jgi:Zn-dependent peptidase ImmA (M78 family)/transcriptional regulator with XRE-family HTH domain
MIGERVRLAREAARMTQRELSALAEIGQGALSDIEAGRVLEPSRGAISAIAKATLYPTDFFYLGPLPDLPDGHYRRRRRGTSKVGKQVRAQVRQIVELVQRTESQLKLPPIQIEPLHSEGIRDIEDVETAAAEVRAMLGLGSRDPIPNLTRAVERSGVIVVRLPTTMEDHDGFSAWPDFGLGGRPIIALTIGHTGDRDRFTIGHELGHIILHTLRSNVETGQAEIEANRFAGALLLPREAALEAMRPPVTLRVLMAVKATFGTSIAMAARRAWDLDLITRDHYVSLQKQLSTRGWTYAEPVEVGAENPLLIAKIIDLLAGHGTTMQRASRVWMPLFTFRAIAAAAETATRA